VSLHLGTIDPTVVALIIPLIVVQLAMLILAIADLLRDDRRVRGGNKGVWAVVIVFVNILGPILYFLVGREEGPVEPTAPGPGAMPGWGSPHDPPIAGHEHAAPTESPAGAPMGVPLPAATGVAVEPGALTPATVPVPVRADAGRTALDADAPSAISIERLSKRYQAGGVLALDDLSMVVPEG
jgi:hypothetical protein